MLLSFPPLCEAQPLRNDGPGPWDRDVVVYRAGSDGSIEKLAVFERAGVPTIERLKDKRLIVAHQHFPANDEANFDKIAVRFSADEGKTWTKPEVIRLIGLPEGMRFPFDPTLVTLPDERVRLYFTSLRARRFDNDRPAIYSAISTDGIEYTYEPGLRFGIQRQSVIDCAVVLHQDVFHLFAPSTPINDPKRRPAGRPRVGIGYHATSPDGLNFTRIDDVQIDARRWLGNAQSNGRLITFFGTADPDYSAMPGVPHSNLWMATSPDGRAWQLVDSPIVRGGDPGAVKSETGDLIVVITGEPRPGTPSVRQNRPHF